MLIIKTNLLGIIVDIDRQPTKLIVAQLHTQQQRPLRRKSDEYRRCVTLRSPNCREQFQNWNKRLIQR